ncbi:MAG: CapA family protein [Halobacteriovoraceae bacterium]|nr:CapA family protein [Halobacteriovoraceae bacterium]MCB9095838.1 CapA family protein [Halobacteriovoraceae bacterium]
MEHSHLYKIHLQRSKVLISTIPKTPREVFKRKFLEIVVYEIIIFAAKVLGFWKRPFQKASSDVERMTYLDKVYWLFKLDRPISKPEKNLSIQKYLEPNKTYTLQSDHVETVFTISAVGDLLNPPNLLESSQVLYKDLSEDLFSSDLSMANLECCIHNQFQTDFEFSPRRGPLLNFTFEEFEIIKGKFNFMSTACNHSFDFGEEGVKETLNKLKECQILTNGMNLSEEQANRATIFEKHGVKIGIVSYTFGLNGHNLPRGKEYLVNTLNLNGEIEDCDFSRIQNQLNHCHENNVDFIIAHLHWGWEHEFYHRNVQTRMAHYLAEMGIDLILGHHPHVVQPVELYQTQRDSDCVVPIFYSLGNLTNGFSADFLCQSYLANFSLARVENKIRIKNLKFSRVKQIWQICARDVSPRENSQPPLFHCTLSKFI